MRNTDGSFRRNTQHESHPEWLPQIHWSQWFVLGLGCKRGNCSYPR